MRQVFHTRRAAARAGLCGFAFALFVGAVSAPAEPVMSEQLALYDRPDAEVSIALAEPVSLTEPLAKPSFNANELPILAGWISRRYAVNPRLINAVVRAESDWDVFAVSRANARGLAQVLPSTAAAYGVVPASLFVPAVNLAVASAELRRLGALYHGDLSLVLAAYNAGEGAVRRYGGVPPYRETRRYVAHVLSLMARNDGFAVK